jgi:hypothetical protein
LGPLTVFIVNTLTSFFMNSFKIKIIRLVIVNILAPFQMIFILFRRICFVSRCKRTCNVSCVGVDTDATLIASFSLGSRRPASPSRWHGTPISQQASSTLKKTCFFLFFFQHFSSKKVCHVMM